MGAKLSIFEIYHKFKLLTVKILLILELGPTTLSFIPMEITYDCEDMVDKNTYLNCWENDFAHLNEGLL